MKTENDRIKRYNDYNRMDFNPEIACFLNEIRDAVMKEQIEISSTDENVKNILETLFSKFLYNSLWQRNFIRNLIKYGDSFYELIIQKNEEEIYIDSFLSCCVKDMSRNESDIHHTSFGKGLYFKEDWKIAHFRLLNNSENIPYGESVLEKIRKKWKILEYAETIKSYDDSQQLGIEMLKLLDIKFVNLSSIKEAIANELERIAKIQLYYLGYNIEKAIFTIKFAKKELVCA